MPWNAAAILRALTSIGMPLSIAAIVTVWALVRPSPPIEPDLFAGYDMKEAYVEIFGCEIDGTHVRSRDQRK
jgi:hypothetical protein